MFFTKVIKANIIAHIKTKRLGPVLSVKNSPFTFFRVLHSLKLIFKTLFSSFSNFWKFKRASSTKKSCIRWELAEKWISKVKHFVIAFPKNDSPCCIVHWSSISHLFERSQHLVLQFVFLFFCLFVYFFVCFFVYVNWCC